VITIVSPSPLTITRQLSSPVLPFSTSSGNERLVPGVEKLVSAAAHVDTGEIENLSLEFFVISFGHRSTDFISKFSIEDPFLLLKNIFDRLFLCVMMWAIYLSFIRNALLLISFNQNNIHMNTKLYTNVILTVIALLLAGLQLNSCSKSSSNSPNFETVVNAQTTPNITPSTKPSGSATVEYKILFSTTGSDLQRQINELAKEGWKPIGFSNTFDSKTYSAQYSALVSK
jgi:hypothetical protein